MHSLNIVSKKNIKIFNEKGYCYKKNFFSKKILKKVKEEVTNLKKYDQNFYYEKIGKKNYSKRVENIINYSKSADKIINSKKILLALKKLTKKNYCLFKDKLNFKYPGGEGFKAHIDGHFYWKKSKKGRLLKGWNEYSNNFVNLVIPLEKSTKKNGCLYVASSKNTFNYLGKTWSEIAKQLDYQTPNIKKEKLKYFDFKPIEMEAGDILFFDWKCAHFSKKNKSKSSRMIFYATYNLKKDSNVRSLYYQDKILSINPRKNKSLK